MRRKVTIVGTTTWGTTIAIMLARNGVATTILARSEDEAAKLISDGENNRYLPGIKFPDGLMVSHHIQDVVGGGEIIVIAVPSYSLRNNAVLISPFLNTNSVVLSATKGLEIGSNKRMSEVLSEELVHSDPRQICILSGPNLAKEIVMGSPASAVVAGYDLDSVNKIQETFNSSLFRVYDSSDVVGVELAGALKNVIALGAGFCDGLGIGDNAKGALITRGLAEISRLGVVMGAQQITFAGLAGIGDIIATCSSSLSRNHYVGQQLALGASLHDITESMDNVAEGINSTMAAKEISLNLGVEMPIVDVAYRVLFEGLHPNIAVSDLMERPIRSEW